MNTETEQAVEALGGTIEGGDNGGTGGGEGVTDYKAECEKLQKQLQGERVEAGRLKKANEENAALRKKLEEMEAKHSTEEALGSLPENLRDNLPDDYKQGAAALAQHLVEKASAQRDAKMQAMEARFEAEEKRRRLEAMTSFVSRIESAFPGFLASIRAGGDKQEAWAKYQTYNADTIKAALARSDFNTLAYHIKQFYSGIHVEVPSGNQDGSAAPDPRSMGGGVQTQGAGGSGRTYSADEYKRILDEAQTKFQNQQISYKDYSAICAELTNAYREGRVK